MAKRQKANFVERLLTSREVGDAVLLDAIQLPDGTTRLVFKSSEEELEYRPGKGVEVLSKRHIGGGLLVNVKTDGSLGHIPFYVDSVSADIEVAAPETDLFEGLNVLVALRNDESAKDTLNWLRYHAGHHGVDGALIIDRSRPKGKSAYAERIAKSVGNISGLKQVVVLEFDVPLGDAKLPAQAHPYNAPGAPGKDRMDIPAPAPFSAPLGEMIIYELARARFLDKAKAIANIDVSDLLVPVGTDAPETVFEQAEKSKSGCVQLQGQQIYPWRIRKGSAPEFGDHICVQFDPTKPNRRWCIAPSVTGSDTVWRLVRVVGAAPDDTDVAPFYRCMGLRHPTESVSEIVPKTSLIEDDGLLALSKDVFKFNPVRMPVEEVAAEPAKPGKVAIITTMKNEGPFILEWIAYHRVIGVSDFLVYTNDCTDGTDTLLEVLQDKGIVQHRDNPFKKGKLKPQHAALQAAEKEKIFKKADWLICMDVDEYMNIRTGDGTLGDLFKAVGDANMIAMTWRLFGNGDVHEFKDGPIIAEFDRCAPEYIRKPHQAWGFKTLFRTQGIFKKLGVHRPKGLKPQLWEQINWVNGSGKPMPSKMFRNGWRSTTDTYGYDLVQLNHYAVRSAESFLVKRDRGRVNHVDRDQGLAYWFRMNNNAEQETSIQRMLPALRAEMDRLLADSDIKAAHDFSVIKHREKIDELQGTKNYAAFYEELTSKRMERLSKMHAHFGSNVFLAGPECVPDNVWRKKNPAKDFFFTVEKGETAH